MTEYKQLSVIYHDMTQRDNYEEIYKCRFFGDGTFRLPLTKNVLYVLKQAESFFGTSLTIKALTKNIEAGRTKTKKFLDILKKGYLSVDRTGKSYKYELKNNSLS